MSWQGKKVLVVGLGKSGRAAAAELARLGARVTACDHKLLEGEELDALSRAGVELILGRYPEVALLQPHLVVTSPGVPSWEPPLAGARQLGIPIWSELELAYRLLPPGVKIAAVTGTNGKTTTTALCGQILRDAGLPVVVRGNIGIPLVKEIKEIAPGGYVVCEVSSFQLETVASFRPRVAVILNITPDHLDRHGDLAGYIAAKARLMAFQEAGDFAVLNYDDPLTRDLADKTKARVLFFSRRQQPEPGAFLKDDVIYANLGHGEIRLCHRAELSLKGAHNLENCLAASLVALALGVKPEQLIATLKTFPGVPHRLERIAEVDGVLYINDSKGTNPEATMKAIEAYPNPLVLIAGGRNKGSDFTLLAQKMAGRVKYLVLVGEAACDLEQAARRAGIEHIYRASDFKDAVLKAARQASPGDIVMLSPACASWDMFKNYEERGDLFKSIVRELAENSYGGGNHHAPQGGAR
ncbi:UDP-N-acetylmuramoyl-L-alanine--D-glutamate ligase [Moorella sp. E306M]|jgi:UDP-N-acetylmuramoylalanine--D-glutamate ligase|uniref:UDP-N-acetylmuramoyl-L-alanine--D-glutamate ligase n=1 Tax=Moorella sp. E306M TaxID=2572683 RepID=UPI0010FFAEFD|nr:UDP-N-acetylmuramoyl-L-alanine--D-glutamate ligase [Moorella sp. E306M]MDK2894700.1 UDP-N-acetylmuramoylalanine--D-glutamate ligase [Moorella sp. (in: firmicutes)]GEA17082.1 UDP-N-acetylmuramoylalanine--D-glutamate ligase [Moorella sp. E306M]